MIQHPAGSKPFPLQIVGSNKFGRYPKISTERTYNMIVSDGWLVPYAGYVKKLEIEEKGIGRGIFGSIKYNHIIIVIDNNLYAVDLALNFQKIGDLDTFVGDVFIAENNANEIGICDKKNIYIFNYSTSNFTKSILDFIPGYLTFQNGYFIATELNQPKWRLSALNNGLSWPAAPANVGEFQTNETDTTIAAIPMPGNENQLLIFGNIITQSWTDVGAQLFPYQKNVGFNIDYGCVNAATIAKSDTYIAWLGINKTSGLGIFYTTGGQAIQVSNDGINFLLARVNNPQNSYGFFARQDGHLIYHITFANSRDNFTLIYDFNTQMFFYITNESMDKHIAKKIVFFNNKYYFISDSDANLYELSSDYTTYDGKEIPRTRITPSIRFSDSDKFIVKELNLKLEQGENKELARLDMSISRDGGVSFGNNVGYDFNNFAERQNIVRFFNLGMANEFVAQFKFWGQNRFVVGNGEVILKK